MDKFDGMLIKAIIRDGKNGKRYTWKYPTIKKIRKLVDKYGIDQITDLKDGSFLIWLQY